MSEKIINKQNLLNNFSYLKKKSGCKMFCAVVKANAYGHGFKNVVPVLEKYVDYFAVANFIEAKKVKKLQKTKPILILSPEINPKIEKQIELTIASVEDVSKLEKFRKKVFVHLKINTGMNRFGANLEEIRSILEKIRTSKFVKLKGVFTHFHSAENKELLEKQKKEFKKILSQINLPSGVLIHHSNTQASLFGAGGDMCRCGIGLYGFESKKLKEVLEIKSKIVAIQNVKAGDFVGYSAGFIAKRKMKIGVVKIGYADGFIREYNFGSVFINGKACKIIGNVCMDCIFVDLSKVNDAKIGDDAKIIWSGNSIKKISEKTKKIPYEILCTFNSLR